LNIVWLAYLCAVFLWAVIRGDVDQVFFTLGLIFWIGERLLVCYFPSRDVTAKVLSSYFSNYYKRPVKVSVESTSERTTITIEAAPAASEPASETK